MVVVRDQLDEPVAHEAVHRRVDALPGEPHAPGDLRNREGVVGERDRAQDLPACRGESVRSAESVTRFQQPSVHAERCQDDLGGYFSSRRPPRHDVRTSVTADFNFPEWSYDGRGPARAVAAAAS
jgi:hypothetical protein